jgi:hypothetical protein
MPPHVQRFPATRSRITARVSARAAGLLACVLVTGVAAGVPPAPAETIAELPGIRPVAPLGVALDDPVTRALWTAVSLERILSERDYPAVLSLALLNRSVTTDTAPATDAPEGWALTEPSWLPAVDALARTLSGPAAPRLERCRGLSDPVEGTLCAVETLAPLLPGDLGRGLADEGARLVGAYLRPGEPPLPGVNGLPSRAPFGGEGLRFGPLQRYAESALDGTIGGETGQFLLAALMGASPGAANTEGDDAPTSPAARLSELVTSLAGFPPDARAAELLAGAPGLGELVRAHPALASLEGSVIGAAGATVLETRAFLDAYQGFLSSVRQDGEGGLGAWASERAFVHLVSRSASLSGLEAGLSERIRVFGNAAADLRIEGRAFRSNLASFGQQAAMSVLSGNVFSLAAGVAGFLQLTPGTTGPAAAEDLRALRGLVGDLRNDMTEGLAGVEVRLAEILSGLDGGFARMERLVASGQRETRAELGILADELRALGGRVDRLEANLVTYLEAGFDREHTRTLVRCLQHRERHLPPFDEMDFPVFSGCLADFRVRGARDARDALLTDRTTPVDDQALVAALSDMDPENLARRLPLMARAAEQRFGYSGLGGGRGGANPVEWAVASQAYLSMIAEWPGHASRVTPGDLEELLATGVEIQRILSAIPEDPSTGRPGGILFPVLETWEAAAAELTEEAEVLARRHQQAQLRRVDPTTLLTRMSPEEVGRPVLPAPRRVAGNVPAEVRTAAVLALEEPVLVYRTVQTDSVTHENVRRAFLFFGRRHDRITHTRTRLEVELRIAGGEVVNRFRTEGPWVLRRVEEMSGDVPSDGGFPSDRVRSMDERIPDPTDHFLAEHLPRLANDLAAWHLVPPDPYLLRTLEDRIEAEMRRFESASLNLVFTSACRAIGTTGGPDHEAAGLTEADRASALRIRSALDRMTTARTLLLAYVRLGLPDALDARTALADALSAALTGDEGLLDRGALCAVVEAGESPLRVVWLEEEPRERAAGLRRALDEVLAGRADGVAPSIVDATIQHLRAAIRLQAVRVRTAG